MFITSWLVKKLVNKLVKVSCLNGYGPFDTQAFEVSECKTMQNK